MSLSSTPNSTGLCAAGFKFIVLESDCPFMHFEAHQH